MGDGEIDFSNIGEVPCGDSMDSLISQWLKDTHACTHTHTCNPPGPDFSHTHTCFHVHTKIVPATSDDKDVANDDSAESCEKKAKKRPVGNREAVRKYREKQKARAASLEDEVIKLRAMNQQLIKRLRGQVALEAEVARLKYLLVDIRGRIEGEIGAFPYQKPVHNVANHGMPGAYVANPCNVPCNDQMYCVRPGTEGGNGEGLGLDDHGFSDCDLDSLNCYATLSSGSEELPACGVGNVPSVVNTTRGSRKRGAKHALAD